MKKTVTRFTASERWFHNVVMVTFVFLLVTGLGMLYYNLTGQQNEPRRLLVLAHEVVAVVFLVGPVIAFLLGSKKIWKENFSIIARWGKKDIEWLVKKPFTVIFKSIKMPRDDKFNPGQKVWATIAVSGSATLAVTGVIMWATSSPIAALVIHTVVALLMLFALLGHAFMALVNPDTRPGLGSILDGRVDYDWASHHHPLWIERLEREKAERAAARRRIKESSTRVRIAAGRISSGRIAASPSRPEV